ncbi:MAG: family 16 glycosylhydrolase [Planctomycetota bacterium]
MKRTVLAVVLAVASGVHAQDKPLRGAEVWSRESVLHGRFEMRLRSIRASGTLATFFLYKNECYLPGVDWEEIDIEVFGKDDGFFWQSNIITGEPRENDELVHEAESSFADGFHVFAIEWTPESVAWFVDGEEIRRATGENVGRLVSEQSMRFNLWASSIEEWTGPVEAGRLPVYQYVDWFKYSRYEDGRFVHEWTDDFERFDESRWQKADWSFDINLAQFTPENVLVRDGMLILALTPPDRVGDFDAARVGPDD